MSEERWQQIGGHPTPEALVLHLEGELEGCEAVAVAQHLKDCWICRTRSERLQQGIYAFVDYRRAVLLPSVPPPPPTRSFFYRRLREEFRQQTQPSLLSALWRWALSFAGLVPRGAWISVGTLAVLVLVLGLLQSLRPVPVSAAEFLRRAQESTERQPLTPKHFVYQKIRIRHGDQVVERELYHGVKRHGNRGYVPLNAEWDQALRPTPIDWENPLSAQYFAAWRSAQANKLDTVSESTGAVTLTTVPSADVPVLLASLTVRQSDWHPIAERVELRGGPAVEVSELAYEVRDVASLDVAEAPAATATPAPPAAPSVPSEEQLQDAEAELREALHQTGADIQEVPEIEREGQRVRVRMFVDSTEREQEIVAALRGIPHVTREIHNAEAAGKSAPLPSAPANEPSTQKVYATQPPLAQALWDHLGGMEPANNYLNNVRDSYLSVLVNASALERLATRYPDSEWEKLSPQSRQRLNRIAADEIAAVQKESAQYLTLLSPVMDEMMRQQRLQITADNKEGQPGCQDWRGATPQLAANLRHLQTAFRRLFIEDHMEAPLTLSVSNLLQEAAQSRAQLQKEISQLCQP